MTTQQSDGSVLVDIEGRTRAPASGVLWIGLKGRPAAGGGVTMSASGAGYDPPSVPAEYVGKITSLDGTRLVLALRGPHNRLAVHVTMRIDGVTHRISGMVSARPATAVSP